MLTRARSGVTPSSSSTRPVTLPLPPRNVMSALTIWLENAIGAGATLPSLKSDRNADTV